MATTPLDIHMVVIEWVYQSSQHAAIDYPTLRACALVCRAWTPVAQRLLFRRVPIPKRQLPTIHSTIVALFVRTLRNAPHLAAHVRSFHFDLVKTKSTVSDAMEALALCTNVDGITANLYGTDSSFAALIAQLDTLPVRPSFLSVSGRDSFVDRIMQIWPSIRILDMGAIAISDMHVRMPRELQALSTRSSPTRTYGFGPKTVAPMLRDLEIECHDGMSSLVAAALVSSGVAPQLRSLCLLGHGAEVPPPAVLEELAALESFVLDRLPTEACGLPKNLRHLGYHFHGIGHERIEKLHILLDVARTLPKLNMFTATRQSSQVVLEEIERWCLEGGFEFVVYPEPACFPRPRHVDWI
ncbi:hypothetical protein FA95DRAFT_1609151 [Auriscalpium vulgare]|uniref:Uncharacterized protein n=1 Tax=Auriscalpium vulgare TaxID=40419 RepID=A0ACB8RHK0_9AGAM|nr:hypothetical protein FA95DRAFT_1609151 [Auriscalpium vulgare]